MPDSINNISPRQVALNSGAGIECSYKDDIYIINMQYDPSLQFFLHPCRIDFYALLFCRSGHLCVEVNLRENHLSPNTMIVGTPGNIVKVVEVQESSASKPDFVVMLISKKFIQSFKFDVGKIFARQVTLFSDPVIAVEGKHFEYCSMYFMMLRKILSDVDFSTKAETIGMLVTSLFYYFAGIMESRYRGNMPVSKAPYNRSLMIFEHFCTLVTESHLKERNLSYYADRLGITPKYLSKLIRDVSGRSAPEWIDSFIILEAKSLLKYSDLTIKEIVSRLGFTSSSVFCKFFHKHTGMTPSEYRES